MNSLVTGMGALEQWYNFRDCWPIFGNLFKRWGIEMHSCSTVMRSRSPRWKTFNVIGVCYAS